MPKPRRGRPDVFSAQQNIALRSALRRLKTQGSLSQERVGAVLGVSQQTASKLLVGGGFSYATATALVRALGFPTIDAFFVARKPSPAADVAVDATKAKAS